MTKATCLAFAAFFLPFFAQKVAAQCDLDVDAGPDIHVCQNGPAGQLSGSITGQYQSFVWAPSAGLSATNVLDPFVTTTSNRKYWLKATAWSDENLIQNPDFEGGYSDFSTSYIYDPVSLWLEGRFTVTDNPQSVHPNFQPCTGHGGGGQMMVVNGAGVANAIVWSQTVPVTPNTLYKFSYWGQTVVAASPASQALQINGVNVGPPLVFPGATCNWVQFNIQWNSGPATSASLTLINLNTALSGNDYAIDDIVFSPQCVDTDTVEVFYHPAVTKNVNATICAGQTFSVGGVDFTDPGLHSVTLQTVWGCDSIINLNLKVIDLQPQIFPPDPTLNCATSSVFLSSAGSIFPPGTTYLWTPSNGGSLSTPPFLPNATATAAGTYELKLSWTNGSLTCTATAETQVTSTAQPPTANAGPDKTIGCVASNIALVGSGSAPSGDGVSFAWTTIDGAFSGPQNQATATATSAGQYILEVTSLANGCKKRDTVAVVPDLTPPTANAGPDQTFGCTSTSVALTGSGTGPTGGVSFAWTTIGGSFSGPQDQATATASGAGLYVLETTSLLSGCKKKDTVAVIADVSLPMANAGAPDTLTCSKKVISLAATASVGPNFSATWTTSNGHFVSPPGSSLNPQIDAAGTYVLTISNLSNGCTAVSSVTIGIDTTAPAVGLSAPFLLNCLVQNDTIFGSGNPSFQWTWTTSGGNILSGQNSFSPVVDAAGRYFLKIKNPINGCESTSYVDIQKDVSPPTVAAGADFLLTCSQPTASLVATFSNAGNAPQIGWSVVGTGSILTGQNATTMTTATPGIYLFTVTNPTNGCTATDAAEVLANPSIPVLSIAPPDTLSCVLKTQTLVGTAALPNGSTSGITLKWTTVGGQINGPSDQLSVVAAAPGQYFLTATNTANGCTSALVVEVFEDLAPPVASAIVPHHLNCLEPIVPLDGSGSSQGATIKFEWTTSDGQIFFGSDAVSAVVGKAGTYLLTVTDLENGCSATATAVVLEDFAKPKAEAGAPDTLTCVKNQVLINGIGSSAGAGFFYKWKTADGQIAGADTTLGIVAEKAGTYVLTVIDWKNGCKSTDSVRIFENRTLPTVATSASNTLTCELTEAELFSTGSSAGPDFQTVWTTLAGQFVAFTPSITVAVAGQWWLTVTDRRNGCSATAGVAISENIEPPFADAGFDETLDCSETWENLQGAADAQGAAMSIFWTTPNGQITAGATTLEPTVAAAGLYFLTVKNLSNGCVSVDSARILPDAAAPVVSILAPEKLTCAKKDVALAASVAGGASGLLISWQGPSSGSILQNAGSLAPTVGAVGQYILTVENPQNGCKTIVSTQVMGDFEAPTISFFPPPTLTCAAPTAKIEAKIEATGGPVSLVWTSQNGQILSGGTTFSPAISGPAFYVLTATNATNGCSATDSIQVLQNVAPPVASILPPDSLTCAKPTVKISAQGSSAGAGFLIEWTAGPGGQITAGAATLEPTVAKTGFYFLKITDSATGCKSFDTVFVKENKVAPTVSILPTDTLDCVQKTVALAGQGAGQTPFLVQKWTTSGGQFSGATNQLLATATAAGTYFLEVTDPANGCSATATATVKIDTAYPKISIIEPPVLTCRDSVSTLDATASSSGPSFFFEWKTTGGNFVLPTTTLAPKVDKKGAYSLIISDLRNGCSVQATVSIGENIVPPMASAQVDDLLDCETTSVEIWNATASPTYQFFWATSNGVLGSSATDPMPKVLASGAYFLTVTDAANGCTATSSVEVFEEKLASANVVSSGERCGGKLGHIAFENATGGTLPYRFSIDGGVTWQANPVFEGLKAGDYEAVVADAGGCELFFDAKVDDFESLKIEIEQEATIVLGHEFQLAATVNVPEADIEKIEWTPAATLSCADCLTPIAAPLATTRYKLKVEDVNGCADEAFFLLHVEVPPVFAPNSISSTAQLAQNQWFTLFADAKAVVEIRALKIFDRWGNQVFQNQNFAPNQPELGWSGLFRGDKMQPEVFVWWAEVVYLNGKIKLLKGDLTVTD